MSTRELDEEAVLRLSSVFEGFSLRVIRSALKKSEGDAELAAAALLESLPPAPPTTARPGGGGGSRQARSAPRTKSRSWSDLQSVGACRPDLAAQYRPAGARPAADLAPADFPQTLGAAAPAAGSQQQRWAAAEPAAPPPETAARATAPSLCADGSGAASRLAQQHPWAGAELVALVLEAAAGEEGMAAALLFEMAAPPPGQQPSSAGATIGGGSTAGSSAPAAAQQQRQLPAAASGCRPGDGDNVEEEEEEEGQQQDAYYLFRRRALQLTRRWQRLARQGAGAYAAGAHSEARQLAANARRLRQESLAAHAEAAERILAHNNSGGGLFDLDLHGLHAAEATAALDSRLELLAELAPDLGAAAGGGGSGGGRRSLRVVTGRGLHSSAGDAALPRVVEQHLQALGCSYVARTGAFDVALRRPPRR